MMPFYRFALFLLVLIVAANVLLYHWFAAGTRETSADEIVQKVYVISRLLSETAGYSLANKDSKALENAVAEAFKDRHIVRVTIIDSKGIVLLENAAKHSPDRLNTFDTPVTYAGKDFGKLITSFVPVDENDRITSRLSTMATRQLGLIALLATLLTILCLRERHVRGKAVVGAERGALTHHQDAVVTVSVATSNGRTCDSGNSVTAAAEMVHEGVSIMKQRVFPAVGAVLGSGDAIATQISSLLLQVDECGDRSLELSRCCNELFDLVDEVRLLRCHPALGSDQAFTGKDGPLDLLSGRLESLATTLKRETQGLLGAFNEASVIGIRALSHVDTSRSHLGRTGAAVEDALQQSLWELSCLSVSRASLMAVRPAVLLPESWLFWRNSPTATASPTQSLGKRQNIMFP